MDVETLCFLKATKRQHRRRCEIPMRNRHLYRDP
jgi:hypothetical protein